MSEEKEEHPFQPEIDRAVTWWSRYLSGRLLPGVDPDLVARRGVEQMLANGWRVIPPPPPYKIQRDQPPVDTSRNEAVQAVREKFNKITGKDPT